MVAWEDRRFAGRDEWMGVLELSDKTDECWCTCDGEAQERSQVEPFYVCVCLLHGGAVLAYEGVAAVGL